MTENNRQQPALYVCDPDKIMRAARYLIDAINAWPGNTTQLLTPDGKLLVTDWGYVLDGLRLIEEWAGGATDRPIIAADKKEPTISAGWIPGKPPRKYWGGHVLVTLKHGAGDYEVTEVDYGIIRAVGDEEIDQKIVAWQPMPEPHKEGPT